MQTGAVFLSLKFHRLQPTYVHARIRALQRGYRAFLLCRCDVDDPEGPLAEVAKAALDQHATLLVAFSDAEAARYLELLKAYEAKPADSLKPRVEPDHSSRCAFARCVGHPTRRLPVRRRSATVATLASSRRVASVLTTVRAVNKTDAASIGTAFGTLADALRANEAALDSVPGLGPTKVRRLHAAFTAPFLRDAPPRRGGAALADVAALEPTPAAMAAAAAAAEADEDTRDAREWAATQQAAMEDVSSDEDALGLGANL